MAYSSERKASVISKMLLPHNMLLQRLWQEGGGINRYVVAVAG